MTFVEHHGIPPIGSGLSLGHILYLQLDRARGARGDRRVRRGDGLRDRAPHRPHHRVAAHARSWSSSATTARSARPRTTTSSCELAGVDADAAAAARHGRRRRSARCCPTSPTELGLPGVGGRVRGDQRHRRGRGRHRRVHAGPRRPRDRHDERARRRGRRLPHRPRAPDPLDAGPVRRPLRRVRGERAGRQGRSSTCSSESCTPTTSSATTASPTRSRALDAALDATAAGRRRRAVPALARRLARADGERHDARRLRATCRSRPSRRDLVRAVVEGVAHNLAWLLPHVEAFTGDAIDEVAFVGGAARSARVVPGPRRRARPARRCRSTAPEVGIARGDGAARARAPRRALAATTSTAPPRRRRARFEPDPARHERYAYRQVQFEAAYAALLPISEALA